MHPKALTLYGPFELNSFNAFIMLGLGVFLYAVVTHPEREKYITKDALINTIFEATLAAIIGGRLLYVISEWSSYTSFTEIISIWKGGMSMLGALLGAILYSMINLTAKKIALLPLFTIAALYAPLMHSIARIGCFLTGCCYGAPTDASWGVIYTDPHGIGAPLFLKLHPSQLYSSFLYFLLFLVLKHVSKQYGLNNGGRLVMLYLMGASSERFFVDFFRGDRVMTMYPGLSLFSFHQWIALLLFCATLGTWLYLEKKRIPAPTSHKA